MPKYRRVVHYSKHSRLAGHPGGVEKFAFYLSRCIEVEVVTPKDEPVLDDPETLYIVDSHWGLKIGERCRVVCMLHGCAADQGFNPPVGLEQARVAQRPNTRFICNSLQTKILCERQYGVQSELVHLAVDESLFWPPIPHSGVRWLTATAKKKHKGSRVIPLVKWLLPKSMEMHTMSCPLDQEPDEFRAANGFMLLSTHEGFAYSVLEAMAANLPVVCGNHGIAYELGNLTVLDDRSLRHPLRIIRALERALERPPTTRDWVLKNCSFAKFSDSWKRIIHEEQNG